MTGPCVLCYRADIRIKGRGLCVNCYARVLRTDRLDDFVREEAVESHGVYSDRDLINRQLSAPADSSRALTSGRWVTRGGIRRWVAA